MSASSWCIWVWGVSWLQQGVLMCSSRSERLALHAKNAYASHEAYTRRDHIYARMQLPQIFLLETGTRRGYTHHHPRVSGSWHSRFVVCTRLCRNTMPSSNLLTRPVRSHAPLPRPLLLQARYGMAASSCQSSSPYTQNPCVTGGVSKLVRGPALLA